MAQPPLSAAIRQLERHLGTRLFERNGRVELTPAGNALLDQARQALLAVERALQAAVDADRGISGRLKLGVDVGAVTLVSPLALEFARTRPRVEIDVAHGMPDALQQDLLEHRRDAVVALCPKRVPGLDYVHVDEDPACIVVAPEHAFAGRPRVSVGDLLDQTLVLGPTQGADGYNATAMAIWRESGKVPRTIHASGLMIQNQDYDPRSMAALTTPRVWESLGRISGYPSAVLVPLEPVHRLPFELITRAEPDPPALAAFRAVVLRRSGVSVAAHST